MFFKRKAEEAVSHTVVAETLEWPQAGRRSQSLRIAITSWLVKVTPMLKYPSGCKTALNVEGRARIGTTANFPVYAEIEVPIDLDPPGYLTDRWENVPECVDGHASLSLDGVPQLFVTLFASKEAIESVMHVLVAGFSTVGGIAALDMDIAYPDEMGVDFWKEAWQEKTLRVVKWEVCASAALQG